MDINEEQQQMKARYDEWAAEYNLRISPNAKLCPRVIARKRCMQYSRAKIFGQRPRCACQNHILDHMNKWRHWPTGEHILTAEPYNVDPHELARLNDDCKELGLKVRVMGYSPYLPDRTTMIVIVRE